MAYGKDPFRIIIVEKALTALPQTTVADLFDIAGGPIQVVQLYGVVTTAIQNQANNTKFLLHPPTGSDVDLCTTVSIANLAVNAILGIPGALGSAATVGLAVAGQSAPQMVGIGTIQLSCAASNTGAMRFVLAYRRIDPRGNAVPA